MGPVDLRKNPWLEDALFPSELQKKNIITVHWLWFILVLLGVSSRNTAKALSFLHMVRMSHVSVWKWIQKCRQDSIKQEKEHFRIYNL